MLELDRTPQTLVIIIYEEGIDQFSGMAYYGGMFNKREVGVRALDFIPEYPYQFFFSWLPKVGGTCLIPASKQVLLAFGS